ncbi:MAG: hypothetical protein HPY53_12450 [Brevinematales bacterium]|nr:hypothetical protein [Brevinematales bacterium]
MIKKLNRFLKRVGLILQERGKALDNLAVVHAYNSARARARKDGSEAISLEVFEESLKKWKATLKAM